MACRATELTYGYDDCRFEKDVDEEFHCSICYNVLKEPRMCRNNEHIFCLDCITEHLNVNTQTCPECNEHLSVETLRRPRVVNNYLSKLKINCDYADRGCPEYVCVADLKTHVENCAFALSLCSNEECGMGINKHEYREVKCHDCRQMRDVVGRLEVSVMELHGKVEASNEKVHGEFKKVAKNLQQMDEKINEKVEDARDEIRDMKENFLKVNKDVDRMKVMMSQMLEKLNMLELFNKLPSPTVAMLNAPRNDILIAGGWNVEGYELFSWEKNVWFEVSPMNESHEGASSFMYNDQLFVVGGAFVKTIETLNLRQLPLKWLKFDGELPYEFHDHQTVVYKQHIIHIGGFEYATRRISNMISELQLTSPCTMIELCQMPERRKWHSAEIFEDKVLILGGYDGRNTLDSVLEFDVKKNEVKKMPPLPCASHGMGTVRWRDKVVVLGGRDGKGKVLNNVYMYDCKAGQITALPPMLEKRRGCCAVITGNTIVVMGGMNEKGPNGTLSSVECFTMGGSAWEYLPAMHEARWRATAHVLPPTRKYV